MSPTPFADKFVEFQVALEEYGRATSDLTSNMCSLRLANFEEAESLRQAVQDKKVRVLQIFNDVLTELQVRS